MSSLWGQIVLTKVCIRNRKAFSPKYSLGVPSVGGTYLITLGIEYVLIEQRIPI